MAETPRLTWTNPAHHGALYRELAELSQRLEAQQAASAITWGDCSEQHPCHACQVEWRLSETRGRATPAQKGTAPGIAAWIA